MKALIKLNGCQVECETAGDLKQLKRKVLDLNNGETIKLVITRKQRVGMSDCSSGFAENLIECLK